MYTLMLAAAVFLSPMQDVQQSLDRALVGLDAVLAERKSLALTTAQVKELRALQTQVRQDDATRRNSSKPWITRARVMTAEEAERRTLQILDVRQRERAKALMAPKPDNS